VYAGSRVRDGENRKRFISFKFTHDFDYPETLLYKFTKGDWSEVEIDSNGNRTENRSTTKHTGIQKEHVGRWRKNWLPFKQNYLPQVLISDEFEIPQLNRTRKYGRYFLTIMMIQRKDTL
jgi:hypothetical protein